MSSTDCSISGLTLHEKESKEIPTLLALPRELRDLILLHILLETGQSYPFIPDQPAVTKVSKHLRCETLPTFYAVNTFRIQLDSYTKLELAQRWVKAIGRENVRCLRKVELCGWRRVPFGHMVRRIRMSALVNLRAGLVAGEDLEKEELAKLEHLVGYHIAFVTKTGWDAQRMGQVMEVFWGLFAGY